MSGHDSVGNTDAEASDPSGAGVNPHESVSGGTSTGEAGAASMTESFEGESGQLESVPGFDRDVAEESMLSESVDVTGALSSLPPAEALAFQAPETVCGADNRTRISPATAIPWRWNCELLLTFPDGSGARGTGWFLGPRTVGTAGHCVFSKANGGWATKIEVIPGMDGTSRPYGSQIGTSFRSTAAWVNSANPEYDYGAIILPNATLGNTVGYFGFANLSDAELQNAFLNTSGYPGDKPFGTQWFNGGAASQVTARKIFYMADTYGGQSGSAVWRFANNMRHVVAIHAYGGCPNSGSRVNAEVYNNLLTWRNV